MALLLLEQMQRVILKGLVKIAKLFYYHHSCPHILVKTLEKFL